MVVFTVPVVAQTKVIAHRGYWKTQGSAQNSIASLSKAAEIGVYGSEFDVHVTKDGVPVVHHDPRIGCKKIEKQNYSDIKDHRLSNGERLPTLKEYLAEGAKFPELKLIMEVKQASSSKLEKEWVGTILSVVKEAGAENQVEYISFSLNVIKELLASEVEAPTAYLKGDISPAELAEQGIKGLDYKLKIMKSNPGWFEEAREAGVSVNVWTVNNVKYMRWLISKGADFITTDEPVILLNAIE